MAEKQGFVVRHMEPELLVPAKPTPHEIKQLSDIDDQKGLRMHFHMIMFYRANPLVIGKDPVGVIRDALAEALVWYYPLAGRLVEGPDEDKFMVDCNGEGILFVEADISDSALQVTAQHQQNSQFDLITACIWRARTRALDLNGDQTTSVVCTINVRDKGPPVLRDGYYGNAVVFPAAVTEARRLYDNPLDYAVKLIEEAKGRANEDYIRSMVNFMASKGRPPILRSRGSFIVTDLSRLGFSEVDFGWGKPVYGGSMEGERSATIIAHARCRNSDGEDGIVVPVFLPPPAMKRFEEEMNKLTALMPSEVIERPSKSLLKSTL
ncbi:PREDICTED: methanol O-anthraniloyltransferase-like [Ipomoea nil]|uniref:methanol O-anthraniloyltransferase-like n=1 Tax=Ipomoea nil TaxID=35883 RepID=UPI000900F4DB|nr:PREDICTED: methanol O-anthraniloyltransferase-like [Ipomoea nil]